MALAESQLVPQELHCVKACGHPLVSDQLDVWSRLATAQGWVDGWIQNSPSSLCLLGMPP